MLIIRWDPLCVFFSSEHEGVRVSRKIATSPYLLPLECVSAVRAQKCETKVMIAWCFVMVS